MNILTVAMTVKNVTGHAPVAALMVPLVTSVIQRARHAPTQPTQVALMSAQLASVALYRTQDSVSVKSITREQPTNVGLSAMKDVGTVPEPASTSAFAVKTTTI